MAKKKYDEEEGVWRTIGGRRVFIKKGQSLSDAMKESGKFKKKDEEENKPKTNKIPREYDKITYTQKIDSSAGKIGDKFELTKDEYGQTITKNLRTGETYQANMSMLRSSEAVEINDIVKETKSIHTQSGSYTPSELKTRDESIKQLYKDTWNGNKSYKDLHNELEQMKKEGKISQGELDSLQYDASMESQKESDWREQIKKNNEETDRITKELELKRNTGEYYMNYDKWSDDYYGAFRENERRNAKIKKEIPTEPYENVEAYAGYIDKLKKYEDKENVTGTPQHWMGTEYTNDEFMEHLTDANWHTERRMLEDAQLTNQELSYIKDRTKLGVWSADLDRDKTQKLIDEAKAKFRGKEDSITAKYKGTIDYLKETTDMSEAEIIELLRKRGKK